MLPPSVSGEFSVWVSADDDESIMLDQVSSALNVKSYHYHVRFLSFQQNHCGTPKLPAFRLVSYVSVGPFLFN